MSFAPEKVACGPQRRRGGGRKLPSIPQSLQVPVFFSSQNPRMKSISPLSSSSSLMRVSVPWAALAFGNNKIQEEAWIQAAVKQASISLASLFLPSHTVLFGLISVGGKFTRVEIWCGVAHTKSIAFALCQH